MWRPRRVCAGISTCPCNTCITMRGYIRHDPIRCRIERGSMSPGHMGGRFEEARHRDLSPREANSPRCTRSVEVDVAGRDAETRRATPGRRAARTQGRDTASREIRQAPLRLSRQAEASSRRLVRDPGSRESPTEQRNLQVPLGSFRRSSPAAHQFAHDRHRETHESATQKVTRAFRHPVSVCGPALYRFDVDAMRTRLAKLMSKKRNVSGQLRR